MKISELSDNERLITKCSCTLSFVTRSFWRGRSRPGNEKGTDTCGYSARYLINDKPFCKKHAGFYLIENYKDLGLNNG